MLLYCGRVQTCSGTKFSAVIRTDNYDENFYFLRESKALQSRGETYKKLYCEFITFLLTRFTILVLRGMKVAMVINNDVL